MNTIITNIANRSAQSLRKRVGVMFFGNGREATFCGRNGKRFLPYTFRGWKQGACVGTVGGVDGLRGPGACPGVVWGKRAGWSSVIFPHHPAPGTGTRPPPLYPSAP